MYSTSWKYSTLWKSFLKINDEITIHHNLKTNEHRKYQIQQLNTCSKLTIETLDRSVKYAQS